MKGRESVIYLAVGGWIGALNYPRQSVGTASLQTKHLTLTHTGSKHAALCFVRETWKRIVALLLVFGGTNNHAMPKLDTECVRVRVLFFSRTGKQPLLADSAEGVRRDGEKKKNLTEACFTPNVLNRTCPFDLLLVCRLFCPLPCRMCCVMTSNEALCRPHYERGWWQVRKKKNVCTVPTRVYTCTRPHTRGRVCSYCCALDLEYDHRIPGPLGGAVCV